MAEHLLVKLAQDNCLMHGRCPHQDHCLDNHRCKLARLPDKRPNKQPSEAANG
jgi:hypothetical protein